MDPTETGKKYDTLTHLWESEKFNRQNGVEAHKRALQFVRRKGRRWMWGVGVRAGLSICCRSKGLRRKAWIFRRRCCVWPGIATRM